jgi:hypothetical protein
MANAYTSLSIEELEQGFIQGANAIPQLILEERFTVFTDLSNIVKEVRKRWIKLGKSPKVEEYRKANAVYLRLCSYAFTLHQHLGIKERRDAKKLIGGGPSFYMVRVISIAPTGVTAVVKSPAGQKQEVDLCDLRPILELVQ